MTADSRPATRRACGKGNLATLARAELGSPARAAAICPAAARRSMFKLVGGRSTGAEAKAEAEAAKAAKAATRGRRYLGILHS